MNSGDVRYCQVRGPRDLSNFRDCEHEALTSLRLGLGVGPFRNPETVGE